MPLTAEEKKQRKLEKKAQKIREAQELMIKNRKDELAREVELSLEARGRHSLRWYRGNYAAHFPLIRDDMEAAWSWFDHTLDTKDFIASHLMDSLDEAKVQQDMFWQDVSLKMDQLIDNFHKTIENMDSEYQNDKRALIENAMMVQSSDQEKQENLEEHYKTVIFVMAETFKEAYMATQGEYVNKRDEEAKKSAHSVESLTAMLENNLRTVVNNINHILQEHKDETEMRRREVEDLRSKDDFFTDMIRRQDARMAKLCNKLTNLQKEVNEKRKSKLVLEDLKKTRDETYREYMAMRARLTRESVLDSNQLLTLTTESSAVLQDLERIMAKGEKIIRLGMMCSRLETQEEKVVPFGFPAVTQIEEDMGVNNNIFRLFWRRYAKANLTRRKLAEVREALALENKQLTQQLHTAFEMMSIGPSHGNN